MLRSGDRASKVPTRPHGTTGTLVSATSIPSPCLKGMIDPLRLRPPSGKMMKIARSSCNFRRRSASACGPQFFSPHRQGVKHDCRKCACRFRLKEDVARGDGKGAFAMAGSECCSKSQCVEMAAMIRGEHKRPVRRGAYHGRRSLVDVQSRNNPAAAKNKHDAQGSQEARFRAARCGTVHLESGRCRGQVGGSKAPSEFSAAKNLLLLADSEPDEIIDVMKHGRRNKDQAIEPIEDSAMTRNEF